MKGVLTDFLLPSTVSVNEFRKNNKHKVELANSVLQIEWEIVSAICQIPNIHWLIISHVQTVHQYHQQALLLAMSKRPEIGMAVMRLACELTRDLCRIVESPGSADLWLEYRSSGGHSLGKKYRQVFRFSEDDSAENGVYNLYNIFSNYGVHGHLPMTDRLGLATEINGRGFVKLRPDPKTAVQTFMLTMMCADLHSTLMLRKLKSASDLGDDHARETFGFLGLTYMERMATFHRYVEIYRANENKK